MNEFLIFAFSSAVAFADGGSDHTHGPMDGMGSVLILLGALAVVGVGFHLYSKKKK